MNRKGNVFQFDAWCHRVCLSYIRSMAQLSTVCNRWCALVKVALNRQTDRFALMRIICNKPKHLILIRTARFARSPNAPCCAVITQHSTAERKRGVAERQLTIFYTPMGGLISILYKIYGFRNFCQILKEFNPSYQSIVSIAQITQLTPPKSSNNPIITDQTGSVVDVYVILHVIV